MRGTPRQGHRDRHEGRIIPAHAGNTLAKRTTSAPNAARDHPRACGEHTLMLELAQTYTGSSPRMRGTPMGTCSYLLITGIIPAHAGNTTTMYPWNLILGDHPRACGEHFFRAIIDVEIRGIIPAHAGNTCLPVSPAASSWDHPRACGEHKLLTSLLKKRRGSSPRMRGTRRQLFHDIQFGGIIPAHAGNTRRPVVRPTWCRDHPRACGEHPPGASVA